MLTTPCPACKWPVEYELGSHTVGCPIRDCRVIEFLPQPRQETTHV